MKVSIFLIFFLSLVIQQDSTDLFNPDNPDQIRKWYVVDDGVMGGLSKGSISVTESGNLNYSGYVTTENNGGFSSIRLDFPAMNVSAFSTVKLRIKGDGKKYQFRLQGSPYQRYNFINNFNTSGKWETITLSLNEFYPSYRGYRLDMPNYDGETLSTIAILIGNKKKEFFNLEVERIWLE